MSRARAVIATEPNADQFLVSTQKSTEALSSVLSLFATFPHHNTTTKPQNNIGRGGA